MALLLTLFVIFAVQVTAVSSAQSIDWGRVGCSRSELFKVQERWKWLMMETSLADKTVLFDGVIDYVAKRNQTAANLLTTAHTSAGRLTSPLMAYLLFSDIDMYVNAYTTPSTYISHVTHLALTKTSWTKKIVDNIELLFEGIIEVVGRLILSPSDKTTWTSCLENMAVITKRIVGGVTLMASCDVLPTSGDPNWPIEGSISFSQPALGGRATVIVDLSGFRHRAGSSVKHGMHVHEFGSVDNRCLSAGNHFNPHDKLHGAPFDDDRHVGDLGNLNVGADGRVVVRFEDELVSLSGVNNVVGKSVVVHALEDDLGRGGFADSKTTGHAGGRIGCCIIHRTYN